MSKFSYMHLLGMGKKAKVARAEDGEDGEDKKDLKEENEKDEGKKSKKAEDDDPDTKDDDPDAENKGDDPDAENKGDDPNAEENNEDENKDVKKGRKAERDRCAAIFGSKYATGCPDLAATLAFTTTLSAKEAIRVMCASGRAVTAETVQPDPPKRQTLQDRMASEPHPKIGVDAGKEGGGPAEQLIGLYNRHNRLSGSN